MKYKEFIKKKGITNISKKLKISKQAVHYWLTDERRPDRKNFKKLVEMSDGELTYADYFEEED